MTGTAIEARLTRAALGIALLAAALAPAAAEDKDAPPPRPKEIDALYACQGIADATQRLACFDREIRTVQAADSAGEVIFADREQVKRAKRGLFGLGNIRLGIFSRGDDDAEDQELKEIKAPIKYMSSNKEGKIVVVLEDGARWVQTENARIRSKTEQSRSVTIKKGPLGSYTMVFENGTFMKVKRIL